MLTLISSCLALLLFFPIRFTSWLFAVRESWWPVVLGSRWTLASWAASFGPSQSVFPASFRTRLLHQSGTSWGHFLQVALVNGATTHLLFTLSHPALPEASPVVPDFTMSAYGSSCKYIFSASFKLLWFLFLFVGIQSCLAGTPRSRWLRKVPRRRSKKR